MSIEISVTMPLVQGYMFYIITDMDSGIDSCHAKNYREIE